MFSCKLFKTNVWLGLCARIFWFSNFHFQRTENMGSRESYLSPSNVHTLLENKWNVAETEILHELAHYTTRISSWHSDFRVVSWTNSCSISVFPLYFIAFFTLHVYTPLLRGDFYTVLSPVAAGGVMTDSNPRTCWCLTQVVRCIHTSTTELPHFQNLKIYVTV